MPSKDELYYVVEFIAKLYKTLAQVYIFERGNEHDDDETTES